MAIISPVPMLNSVLTISNDINNDFVNQLQVHLTEIENNFQQTLKHIQQRQPYTTNSLDTKKTDPQIRNQFFDVLKEVANTNNLPFDEPFYRQQFLDKQNSSSSPKVDILRAKPSLNTDTTDQHISPVNNHRRSQFAPVLSSTPVHQISPNTPIPVDLTLATPSVAPVLTKNSTDLPAIPPSAIVPQRANVGRPPRIPRSESNSKKISSPIHEQTEEVIIEHEVLISSKRRIKTKDILVEEQNEVRTEIVKQVQSTPLRGRKKKVLATTDDNNHIPQLEPPPPQQQQPEVEVIVQPEVEEVPAKKSRAGRAKKKQEVEEVKQPTRTASVRSRKDQQIEEVKPTRTASVRGRKKQQEVEAATTAEVVAPPVKKTTRNKKLVEPIVITEEQPQAKLRGKKKSPVEQQATPKKPTTKSRKRKQVEETTENPVENIQLPSPKRRTNRNTKSKTTSPIESSPPLAPIELEPPVSTRSSRRGKKDVEISIEKQEDIVLNKKTRTIRGKKVNQPTITDTPITVVDVVMTSVTVSDPTIESSGSKPPRPPIARKKKSLAIPSISQTSPTTPPPSSSSHRIQSTSPINDKPLLPLPLPKSTSRRRPPVAPRRIENSQDDIILEPVSSTNRKTKRTRSSVASTPKRPRRDNLLVTAIPSTPGKKRNKCTCEKRRNGTCDICASALDA